MKRLKIFSLAFMFVGASIGLAFAEITVTHISPVDEYYEEFPGPVEFICHTTSDSDVTRATMRIRKYYGGWYINEVIHTEDIDVSGPADTDFYLSATVDLGHGFYTCECEAINIAQETDKSEEAKYMTGKGKVYIIHGVDTEPDSFQSLWSFNNNIENRMGSFNPGGNIDYIMDELWRYDYTDSYGNPNKFTWFMRVDEIICNSDLGCDAVPYNLLYDEEFDETFNLAQDIADYGDNIAWHYHNIEWYDYDNDGTSCWNQMLTFNDTEETVYREKTEVELAEKALASLMLNAKLFPISYRAGWVWENTDNSNWLEAVIPVDYTNMYSSRINAPSNEPLTNNWDWSNAPLQPYHPSNSNYQESGELSRVIIPCRAGGNDSGYVNSLFESADEGANMVLCFYSHNFGGSAGGYLKTDVQDLHARLSTAESSWPDVDYVYASDVETIQALLELDDITPPKLSILYDFGEIIVTSNEELYKPPFLAVKDSSDEYYRVAAQEDGPNRWLYDISGQDIVEVAAGAVDSSYNPDFNNYVCGDMAGSFGVDISDLTYLINYQFKGGPAPDPLWIADVGRNTEGKPDGNIDIGDLVDLVNYLFVTLEELGPCGESPLRDENGPLKGTGSFGLAEQDLREFIRIIENEEAKSILENILAGQNHEVEKAEKPRLDKSILKR